MRSDQPMLQPMPLNDRVARQIGAVLIRLRGRQGAKQGQIAAAAGITKGMLSSYERGHHCPSFPTLVRVLQALDCDAETFGRHFGPWGCVRS